MVKGPRCSACDIYPGTLFLQRINFRDELMLEEERRRRAISWKDCSKKMLSKMKDGVWYRVSDLFTPYVSYTDFNKKDAYIKWCIRNGLLEKKRDEKSVCWYRKILASNNKENT